MSKKYLFLYTIGPVQSYIQQSRKTKDLYAASKILSLLSACAMKKILERNSANSILFPYYDNGEEDISYPNRGVAFVEETNLLEFGSIVEKAIREKYTSLANAYLNTEFDINDLQEQLQVYWVFEEYNKSYRESYMKLEDSMKRVKSVRTFVQNDYSEYEKRKDYPSKLQKCNLCGERFKICDNVGKNYISKYKLTRYEGLCSVCLLKRLYTEEQFSGIEFPSTSRIALSYWLNEVLEQEEFRENYEKVKKLLGSEYSDEILYGSNKNDLNAEVKNCLNVLLKVKSQKYLKHRYYALIVFDGDNMGKWVSGEYFKAEYREDVKAQKEVSKLLGEYASWVKTYLSMDKEQLGRVVYAGGDDFLGFVPLDNLFSVLHNLRIEFHRRVNEKLKPYKENPNEELTFSAGVCIAHYKTPLDIVIKEARRQEEYAKNVLYKEDGSVFEKDSFSISVLKRSGEHLMSTLRFDSENVDDGVLITLKDIQKQMEFFSDQFIRVLEREWSRMERINGNDGTGNFLYYSKEMIQSELMRLLRRSCLLQDDKLEREEVINTLYKDIEQLMTKCIAQYSSFSNFISMLFVIEFLGRELHDN